MGRISLYSVFLFFGGADVAHSEFIIVLRAAEKQKNQRGRPRPL
jgi:hypothetical protein